MKLFYLLWFPLFYLFWSSLLPERNTSTGGVVAITFGSLSSLVLFYVGPFIEPGAFGFSRWLSGFVDVVSAPVLLPFFVYLLLSPFRITGNFGNFALLWLIPGTIMRFLNWSDNPFMMILVPLLQSSLIIGISFCVTLILSKKILAIIPAILMIPILPVVTASSYWAFFSHDSNLGYLLGVAGALPAFAAIIVLFYKRIKTRDFTLPDREL